MEQDKHIYMVRHNAMKMLASKVAYTYQEPQKHSSDEKYNKKNMIVYSVVENDLIDSAASVPDRPLNVWDILVDRLAPQTYDKTKFYNFHKEKIHDTKQSRLLHDTLMTVFNKEILIPNRNKSLSKIRKAWTKAEIKIAISLKAVPSGSTQRSRSIRSTSAAWWPGFGRIKITDHSAYQCNHHPRHQKRVHKPKICMINSKENWQRHSSMANTTEVRIKLNTNNWDASVSQPDNSDIRQKLGMNDQNNSLTHLGTSDLRQKISTNGQYTYETTYLRE